MSITMIGLDIAKSVFQVHAVDDAGQVVTGASCSGASCFHSSRSRSLYRPRFLRHRFEPYAASAAVGSCSARIASGGRKPCRSMSQVAL